MPVAGVEKFTCGNPWEAGVGEPAAGVSSICVLGIPDFSLWVKQSESVSRFLISSNVS